MILALKNKSFEDLRKVLKAFENSFGVSLTIHDRRGLLINAEGAPLFTGWMSHKSPCCQYRRYGEKQIAGGDRKCLNECARDVEAESLRTAGTFLHCCWKGITELIVPVLHHHETCIILYAGPFRTEGEIPSKQIPARLFQKVRPLPNQQHLMEMALLLKSIGKGILADVLERQEKDESFQTRKKQIHEYITANLHRTDCSLTGLSKKLSLSMSRTRHLVPQYFGISFQELLWRERMARAKTLLLSRTRSQKEVAFAAGIPNISYFHRRFKQFYGMTPGDMLAQNTLI